VVIDDGCGGLGKFATEAEEDCFRFLRYNEFFVYSSNLSVFLTGNSDFAETCARV